VASLALPDQSFDLVLSTLSLHHWADPTAGLTEIGRVLRPGGRALIWDFRAGPVPLHGRMPDPAERVRGSSLRVVSATPWRWPWRFRLTKRIELAQPMASPRTSKADETDPLPHNDRQPWPPLATNARRHRAARGP